MKTITAMEAINPSEADALQDYLEQSELNYFAITPMSDHLGFYDMEAQGDTVETELLCAYLKILMIGYKVEVL